MGSVGGRASSVHCGTRPPGHKPNGTISYGCKNVIRDRDWRQVERLVGAPAHSPACAAGEENYVNARRQKLRTFMVNY